MHKKRVVALCSIVLLTVLLISSVSAIWPFDSFGKKGITGNVISYSSAQTPICIGNELGAGGCDSGQHFSGQIDEIRIYNRELSSSEVASVKSLSAPTNGLVGYWNLDSSRTPALSGGARVDVVSSYFDSVLTLDGVDDYASIPYSPELRPADKVSFGLWFKPNDRTRSQRLISAIHEGGYGIVMNDAYGTCQSNTICAIVRVGASYVTAQVPVSSITSTNEAALQGWTHVFATFNGSNVKLYLNGQQVAPVVIVPSNRGELCDIQPSATQRTCVSGTVCEDNNGDGIGACRSAQGQPCSISSECLSGRGLICSNNVCTLPSSTTTVALGAECDMREVSNKRVCAADATCQDTDDNGVGACRHREGQSCTQDSECLSGVTSLKCLGTTGQKVCTVQTVPSCASLGGVLCSGENTCRANFVNSAEGNSICCMGICSPSSPNPTCTDSDGGVNYNVRGRITSGVWPDGRIVGSTDEIFDICGKDNNAVFANNENALIEFYCENNVIMSTSGDNIHNCPFGCFEGACRQEPSRYITDISVRGYVGEGLRTLIMGFNSSTTGELSATIDPSWTAPQALSPDAITTQLYLANSGALLSDANPASYAIRSPVTSGATYGLAATSPGNGGQAVLATTGSNIIFSQFSARGYTDENTPLILGFTVVGETELRIEARPQLLPAEFSPQLSTLDLDMTLYDSSGRVIASAQQAIARTLSAGRYSVVIEPNQDATGYMLMEITNTMASSDSQVVVDSSAQITPGAASAVTTNTATPASTNVPTDQQGSSASGNQVTCTSGCLSVNGQICHAEGFRSGSRYCDAASKSFISQKAGDVACDNNFECSSNLCIDSKCVRRGFGECFSAGNIVQVLSCIFGNR